jgi:hypothetical protein
MIQICCTDLSRLIKAQLTCVKLYQPIRALYTDGIAVRRLENMDPNASHAGVVTLITRVKNSMQLEQAVLTDWLGAVNRPPVVFDAI